MKVDVDNFQKLVDKFKKLVDKSIKLVDKQSKVLDKSQNCSSLKIFVAAVALRSTFTCRKMRFCPSLNGCVTAFIAFHMLKLKLNPLIM